MLTRMTRMARMLTHMLTRMTRWLAGSQDSHGSHVDSHVDLHDSLARWLAYYTHSLSYNNTNVALASFECYPVRKIIQV